MAERSSRWAGRGAIALGVAVLCLNAAWIGTHWEQVRPVAPGDVAPLFRLPRADGAGQVALADLRERVVLVDFWATWCKPCVESMPAMERVYKRFHDQGFEVLSVNTEGRDAAARAVAFARRHQLTFPVVLDDGVVAEAYKVTTIPHMVLVDRYGVVRDVHRGVGPEFEAHLVRKVEALIRER